VVNAEYNKVLRGNFFFFFFFFTSYGLYSN
jgi:hypothetical protein